MQTLPQSTALIPTAPAAEPTRETWDVVEVSPIVDFRDLWRIIRKRLPWLILIPAVCVILSIVYLYGFATPLYKSNALIFVDPKFDRILQIEDVHTAASDLDSLNSLEKAITSDSMILRVLEKLELKEDPGFLPKSLQKRIAEGKPVSDSRLLREIRGKRIKASLIRPTRLIELVVLDPDPKRARDITNTIVSEFELFLAEQKRSEAGSSEKDLRRQADGAYERALEAEKQLETFRSAHPEFTVEQDHQLFADRLTRVGEELNFATGKVLELESRVKTLENIDPATDPLRVIEVGKFSELKQVSDLLAQRAAARAALATASTRYTEIHPRRKEVQAQVDEVEEQLRQMATEMKASLTSSLEAARTNEEFLSARVKKLQTELSEVKSLSSKFRAIQQKVETEWLVHENLQGKIGQTSLSTEKSTAITTLMSKPLVAHKASKPSKPITVLASGFFGIFLGMLLIGADLLRGGPFADRRHMENTLRTDVISEIPSQSKSPASEQVLMNEMTKVLFSPDHRQSRLIHVSSVAANQDGIRVAASLASASAYYSCPTLLISVLPAQNAHAIMSSTPQPSRTENLSTLVLSSEFLLAPTDAWQLLGPHCQQFKRIIIESTSIPQDSGVPRVISSFAETNLLLVSLKTDNQREVRDVKDGLTKHATGPLSLVLQG